MRTLPPPALSRLAHRVVLGVGDGLDPTAEVRAHIQRAHALRVAEEARTDRRMRNALHTLTQKKEA